MIGGQELLVIFIVTLILFGPKRIPEVARFLAKLTREVQKAIDEIKREISGNDKFGG
ncbi:MAG: twin-arginine translocase TatA/TatE family subunit [Candidatus Aureabacteria bacterium]|nr:twin-arginine translocase TatA/TatE family subunit [Candidatus Auribacterota bacterium]